MEVPFANGFAVKIHNENVQHTINTMLSHTKHSFTFPGSQPVSIERKHLPLLNEKEYVVCEKTDGVRYMMIVLRYKSLYLCIFMNRKRELFCVKIKVPLSMYKGTILDGELVQNKKNKKFEFIVYDALINEGIDNRSFDLYTRLHNAFNILKHIEYCTNQACTIYIKHFVKFKDFRHYIDNVTTRLNHDSDGYVFTPVHEPYIIGTHFTMFKWKPTNKHTVDFFINDFTGSVYVSKNHNILKVRKHRVKHLGKIEKHINDGYKIFECEYMGNACWKPLFPRTDKDHPNNLYTFNKTLLNIQEDIQLLDFFAV